MRRLDPHRERQLLGHYKNEEISRLFELTFSAVSHCVRETASRLERDATLEKKLNQINSQFKL